MPRPRLRRKIKFDPKGKRVFIIGAGGAAKAVSTYLADSKVRALYIHDIDVIRAINLVERLGSHFTSEVQVVEELEKFSFGDIQLLVNASPIGMNSDDPLLLKPEALHKGMIVYDLVYNPPQTKLLKLAKEKCSGAENGLSMLVYQAAVSEHIWQEIPVHSASIIMRQALKQVK